MIGTVNDTELDLMGWQYWESFRTKFFVDE